MGTCPPRLREGEVRPGDSGAWVLWGSGCRPIQGLWNGSQSQEAPGPRCRLLWGRNCQRPSRYPVHLSWPEPAPRLGAPGAGGHRLPPRPQWSRCPPCLPTVGVSPRFSNSKAVHRVGGGGSTGEQVKGAEGPKRGPRPGGGQVGTWAACRGELAPAHPLGEPPFLRPGVWGGEDFAADGVRCKGQ